MKIRSLRYLTAEGFKNVWVNRLMSIASIGVLCACMLLMGVAILLTMNINRAVGNLQDQNVVMVYFADASSDAQVQTAIQKVKNLENVKEAVFVSKEEGMESLLEDMGEQYEELFAWAEEDGPFLPDGVRVSFHDLEQYDKTILQIKAIENVDTVNDSSELTKTIVGARKVINMASIWIIGLLMITALVIISNTIRITMHNRKLEISIMKAVGATNNFIRIPFVIEGMILGLISAVVTTGLLQLAYRLSVKEIAKFLSTADVVAFGEVGWQLFLLFCGIGIITGCLGSFFSIGKYLRKEGSEFRAI